MLTSIAVLVVMQFAQPEDAAMQYSGKVERVSGSDTIVLRCEGNLMTIRLAGVDGIELEQKYGKESFERLKELIDGKEVVVIDSGHGKDGRMHGRVELDGKNINEQMVREGLAWRLPKNDPKKR